MRAAIEATNAYIARARPAPAQARLLAEGRDGVERALRCREYSVSAGQS